MVADDSVQSLVDFDLSESKFKMDGFFEKNDVSPIGDKTANLSRQGSDSLPSALRPSEQNKINLSGGALNKSGTMNRSNGGPDDELAMSLDETDFGLSESNFSHSMMSNKIGSFVSNTAVAAAAGQHASSASSTQPNFLKSQLAGRDRSATAIEKKPYKMSKNLIIEDDEDLIDETEGKITKSGKKS